MPHDPLLEYLRGAPELPKLCTQNGWIDNDTLRYEILTQRGRQLLLAVEFDEVIMEGSGCVADRKPCYGRIRISQDDKGVYGLTEIV